MIQQAFASRLLGTVVCPLIVTASLHAQPPGQGLRQESYSSLGPVMYGPITYYGAQPAYTGAPLRRSDENDIGFV